MSYDSSHGDTRVGRAGLRIEGKNDDTVLTGAAPRRAARDEERMKNMLLYILYDIIARRL